MAEQFQRGNQLRYDTLDIECTCIAGDNHKGQQSGNNQKKQVVTGVNGRKSQHYGDDDIQDASLADF